MLLDIAQTRRVIFFSGKGGVGKTTVASATSLALAGQGRDTLLVSTDPAHNLGHLFGRTLGDTPTEVLPHLHVSEIDPAEVATRHFAKVEKSMRELTPPRMHKEITRHVKLSAQAPGAHEAAFVERLADIIDQAPQSHIVVDTAPSGHTTRLLELPEIMSTWTNGLLNRTRRSSSFGAAAESLGGLVKPDDARMQRRHRVQEILAQRRSKFERLRTILTSSERCAFFLILTAERLPVLESIEFYRHLTDAGIHVGGLVVNRRLPSNGGAFLESRKAAEDKAIHMMLQELHDAPVHQLPLFPQDIHTLSDLQKLATFL